MIKTHGEKTLIVDSAASMTSYICRLQPFPDGVASSTGLQVVSRAVASRQKAEADASAVAPSAAARTATTEEAARDAGEAASAVEVWQAAERLVEGGVGEGGSSSRSAGSLLASLSRLRGALRRRTNGGSVDGGGGVGGWGGGGGGGGGAWEAMSTGPKGVALARAAVGVVVRICRSERPAAVHLEASRLAGEVGWGVGGFGHRVHLLQWG